jgi:PadR family transcriptional regulator, regulatory protein PadR
LTQPKADLLQGTLDRLTLKALSLGPLHGYGVIQRLRQLSNELLEVEPGRRAKFYTLTKARSKQLTAEEEIWDRLALAVAKVRKAV